MTNTKLAMLALALLSLVAGALIVKHDAGVGGILLAVGGKLIGLTFPEVGAKKDPPPPAPKAVGPADVFPQSMDGTPISERPSGGMDAEFRVWDSRAALACAPLLIAALCLLAGCSILTPARTKTAVDIAHDLCVKHFSAEKPGLSIDDITRTYCKDLDPWVDTVLGAEALGAAKASAKAKAAQP
jgi:hypothetical protein